MAITYVDYTATGGQTDFDFTFPYLEDEHVKVEINGADTTDFTIVASPSTKVVLDSGATAGDKVRVRRRSAPNQNLVDFVNGSVLTESELDLAYRHNRYLSEEIAELNDQSLQKEAGGTEWDALGLRIQNVGTATDTTDAVTKIYLDNKVAQVSSGATQPPLKWVFSATSGTNNTYTVTGAEVLGDTAYEVSIDGLIKEPTVEYTVDPDTDTLTIIPNMTGGEDIVVIQRGFGVAVAGTVGTNSLVDGSVTNAKLASGAVTSDKISTTDTNFNVQSDGKVGIGTASPSKGIEIVNKQGILIRETQGLVDNQMPLISSSIADRLDHTDWGIAIKTVVENISNGYGIAFWTRNAYNGTFSEKLRINEDGYVGILNTTPQYPLDVTGDLNITGDYKVNGTNLQTVPTGTVSAFAGSAAPTGYALCDGSAVNRTTQAALFAVIGTTYGIGDGSTTFNLPDLRGRVVAGLDSANNVLNETTSINGAVLGEVGGDDVHTLLITEMPAHDHGGANSQVSDPDGTDLTIGGTGSFDFVDLPSEGGGQAHNNVQPTIILNYIIKY